MIATILSPARASATTRNHAAYRQQPIAGGPAGFKWEKLIVDDGGVAVEDFVAGDLNGDGRIDIVAGGRQTHNLRIYENVAADE